MRWGGFGGFTVRGWEQSLPLQWEVYLDARYRESEHTQEPVGPPLAHPGSCCLR